MNRPHPSSADFDAMHWGFAVVPAIVYTAVIFAACAAGLLDPAPVSPTTVSPAGPDSAVVVIAA